MQSSPEVDLKEETDEAGRFNLLRLHPPPPLAHPAAAPTSAETESQASPLLRALVAQVKRSMRAMEETDDGNEDKCDDGEEAEEEDEDGRAS
jgi:hypothetical protein